MLPGNNNVTQDYSLLISRRVLIISARFSSTVRVMVSFVHFLPDKNFFLRISTTLPINEQGLSRLSNFAVVMYFYSVSILFNLFFCL